MMSRSRSRRLRTHTSASSSASAVEFLWKPLPDQCHLAEERLGPDGRQNQPLAIRRLAYDLHAAFLEQEERGRVFTRAVDDLAFGHGEHRGCLSQPLDLAPREVAKHVDG